MAETVRTPNTSKQILAKRNLCVIKVRLYANGIFVGQGSTDKYGRYLISYSSPIEPPFSLKVQPTLKHKDGRFQVLNGSGSEYSFAGYKAIYPSSPNGFGYHYNHLGTMNWGSSNSPIDSMNTYNGAWRTWHYAFNYSARLRNHFNGIDIYNNGDDGSYYDSTTSRVYLDSSAQYVYSTIYHELGHAASFKATKGQTRMGHTGYCYPQATCSNGSHNLESQEWANPQFEEGLAIFLGQVGAFRSGNSDPIHCLGRAQTFCLDFDTPNSLDLETSKFSNCTTADKRYEANAAKYLRDLYDSNDVVDLSFSQMIEGVYAFGDHDGNRGKNEHWDIGIFWDSIDDRDGRSTFDYRYLVQGLYNISSSNNSYLYSANCNPVGD